MAELAIAPQHVLSIARIALGGVLYADLRANEQTVWALPIAVCAVALDVADGRVARARGASSARGRLIDNASDAIFIGLCFLALSREIGIAPLLFFTLGFGTYALRALASVIARFELLPSPRGHWAGIANYGLAVIGSLHVHPMVELPSLLLRASVVVVVALNSIAFYDNARLLLYARAAATVKPDSR